MDLFKLRMNGMGVIYNRAEMQPAIFTFTLSIQVVMWEGVSKCTLWKGDQSDSNFWKKFLDKTGGNFDIVIDDGSHVPSHQLLTFETVWPHITPGGIFVIEDIETSYW